MDLTQRGEILFVIHLGGERLGRTTRTTATASTISAAISAVSSAISAAEVALARFTLLALLSALGAVGAESSTSATASSPAALASAARIGKADVDVETLLAAGALRVLGGQINDLILLLVVKLLLVQDERLLPLRVVLALTGLADVERRLLALALQSLPLVERQLLGLFLLRCGRNSLAFPATSIINI